MAEIIADLGWIDLLDVSILAVLFYYLFLVIRGTRGVQLLKGLVIIFLAAFVSRLVGLRALNWFLEKVLAFGALAVLIIFQPEFRNTLIRLAEPGFPGGSPGLGRERIKAVVAAVFYLARHRRGAIIVFEKRVGLGEYISTGTPLDAEISQALLCSLFNPESPLHDGAVIVSGGRAAAAGCLLPLTDRSDLDISHGTRHRAALGLSEQTDALSVVVSEEKGTVSVARRGRLMADLDPERLTRIMERNLKLDGGNRRGK